MQQRWPKRLNLVLIGAHASVAAQCRRARLRVPPPWNPGDPNPSRVSIWEPAPCGHAKVRPGIASAKAARLAAAWIEAAARSALHGSLDALVTAPISKEGLRLAGIPFAGHTEMLASLTGTRRFAMMLIGGPLRVVLVTRHVPLARVPGEVTAARIVEAAQIAAEALPWLGARNRTIGICGLNPHAGDGGAIGTEEQRVIARAIARLRKKGLAVEGPVPADVIFYHAVRGRYGAVVAMYHDQGLGPLKMLAFDTGVNVTLGLPIVRTSPDHGTAYDIAGQGVASPRSMIAAIRLAYQLAGKPNPWKHQRVDVSG